MEAENFKMGWLLVAFDLPVKTREQRKVATDFRKYLLDDGYQMLQYSVYVRPCVTHARMETHTNRIRLHTPPEGCIRALYVTRAQWERSYIIHGSPAKPQSPETLPEQIQLW